MAKVEQYIFGETQQKKKEGKSPRELEQAAVTLLNYRCCETKKKKLRRCEKYLLGAYSLWQSNR